MLCNGNKILTIQKYTKLRVRTDVQKWSHHVSTMNIEFQTLTSEMCQSFRSITTGTKRITCFAPTIKASYRPSKQQFAWRSSKIFLNSNFELNPLSRCFYRYCHDLSRRKLHFLTFRRASSMN